MNVIWRYGFGWLCDGEIVGNIYLANFIMCHMWKECVSWLDDRFLYSTQSSLTLSLSPFTRVFSAWNLVFITINQMYHCAVEILMITKSVNGFRNELANYRELESALHDMMF